MSNEYRTENALYRRSPLRILHPQTCPRAMPEAEANSTSKETNASDV